jgi:hypothetical protein
MAVLTSGQRGVHTYLQSGNFARSIAQCGWTSQTTPDMDRACIGAKS